MVEKIIANLFVSNDGVFSRHLPDFAQDGKIPWELQIAFQKIALLEIWERKVFQLIWVVKIQFQDDKFDGEFGNGFI